MMRIRPWTISHDLGFKLLAVLAGFLESGGDHDAAGNAKFHALAQHFGNAIGRGTDDDQVGNLRQNLQGSIGANAQGYWCAWD